MYGSWYKPFTLSFIIFGVKVTFSEGVVELSKLKEKSCTFNLYNRKHRTNKVKYIFVGSYNIFQNNIKRIIEYCSFSYIGAQQWRPFLDVTRVTKKDTFFQIFC